MYLHLNMAFFNYFNFLTHTRTHTHTNTPTHTQSQLMLKCLDVEI